MSRRPLNRHLEEPGHPEPDQHDREQLEHLAVGGVFLHQLALSPLSQACLPSNQREA